MSTAASRIRRLASLRRRSRRCSEASIPDPYGLACRYLRDIARIAIEDRLPAIALHVDRVHRFRIEYCRHARAFPLDGETRAHAPPVIHDKRQRMRLVHLFIGAAEIEPERAVF